MIDVLKQAVEALGYGYDACRTPSAFDMVSNAITNLKAAIKQLEEAEPVAKIRTKRLPNGVDVADVLWLRNPTEAEIGAKLYTAPIAPDRITRICEEVINTAPVKQEPVAVIRNCSQNGLRVSIMDAGLQAGDYLYAAPVAPAGWREALESIAKNTCCDRCQEAALVAKAALAAAPEYKP